MGEAYKRCPECDDDGCEACEGLGFVRLKGVPVPLALAAPDHALLLGAFFARRVLIGGDLKTLWVVHADRPMEKFEVALDPFGCPVLTAGLRAALTSEG